MTKEDAKQLERLLHQLRYELHNNVDIFVSAEYFSVAIFDRQDELKNAVQSENIITCIEKLNAKS